MRGCEIVFFAFLFRCERKFAPTFFHPMQALKIAVVVPMAFRRYKGKHKTYFFYFSTLLHYYIKVLPPYQKKSE